MRVGHKQGFKICTIGNHSVGKTAIIYRYASGIFSEAPLPTIESVLTSRPVMVDGRTVKLNIWDTAGQERYKSTVPIYLRDVHCIILVFDLSDRDSWESTKEWVVNQFGSFEIKPLMVLCGNKSDKYQDISEEEIKEWAKEQNFDYFLTSALSGKGIKELFMYISRTLMNRFPQEIGDTQSTLAIKQSDGCSC